ncbi:unnamed protein product [Lactuca virosa]|uniref:Protein kinase domain-containing protein n=1 Tax=Lactuca virosa TaxID=75947 RepID=A0AAU9PGS7_9ASTR|nr:unnamed protein product [Lactuca virosa]
MAVELGRQTETSVVDQLNSVTEMEKPVGSRPVWGEIELAESYLVCSMFEDASSSASSVLKRLCDKEHMNTVVDDDIELNDMLESAGMVFVQSLKELGRTLEIISELTQLFDSLAAIPIQVFLAGVCFQMQEDPQGAQKNLEEFLSKWRFVDEKILYSSKFREKNKYNILHGRMWQSICINLAISWVEKAALPEHIRQELLRRLHSIHSSKDTGSQASTSALVTDENVTSRSSKTLESVKQVDAKQAILRYSGQRVPTLWWFRTLNVKFGGVRFAVSNGSILITILMLLTYYYMRRKKYTITSILKKQALFVKKSVIDLWQLAFSYQPSLSIIHCFSGGRALSVRAPLPISAIVMTVAHAYAHLFHVLICISILHYVNSSESDTLLEFKNSVTNGNKLTTWNPSTIPCNGNKPNWEGLLCTNDAISGIRLEGKGLGGIIDMNILIKLPSLITISFQNNSFEGEFPEFKKLRGLRSIFLTGNKFSREVPSNAFEGMRRLKKLYLADNHFKGRIPFSLTTLPRLRDLMLQNNQFEGAIPVFVSDKLMIVNFANNHLRGTIPKRLQKFPASQFSGNSELCGPPLKKCTAEIPTSTIILIASVVVAALAAITLAFLILRHFGTSAKDSFQVPPTYVKGTPSDHHDKMEQGRGKTAAKKIDSSHKLTFFRNDIEKFDLADLLKASAEILGGGVFGSSYKAALTREKVIVVKRFKHMNNVTNNEFVKHMRRLGKLNHPNLVPLIAFYYQEEEKLFVANYVQNFSLAVHLHGRRSNVRQTLDWPTRLKIVKDYGLVPITNQEQARDVMISFKSPEYKQHGRITKKTDAWSLGVLILEIMTGKFPANSFQQSKGGDTELANFMDSMMKEEPTSDVLDKEMGGFDKRNEGQMLTLLNIGLNCCEPNIEKRWDIKEAVNRIEEVREKNDEDDNIKHSKR